jgi:hypothetical protein
MVAISARLVLLGGIFALIYELTVVGALSMNKKPFSRRDVLAICLGAVTSSPLCSRRAADATCLSGDAAPDCIGVYKEPIPPTGETGDDLQMSYGLLRPQKPAFVVTTPKSFDEAVQMLKDQRLAMDDIEGLVTVGKLEEAGVHLLRVLPKITVAGRLVVASVQMETPQISVTLTQAEKLAGSVDIKISQGMRGVLGVSAVAQLTILSELSEVKAALDNLIALANYGAVKVFGAAVK